MIEVLISFVKTSDEKVFKRRWVGDLMYLFEMLGIINVFEFVLMIS